MTFSDALIALKGGQRVSRAGWNGKGMYLLHVPQWEWMAAPPATLAGDYPELAPWIGMRTADAKLVPWLASQTDLLAEDWSVAGAVPCNFCGRSEDPRPDEEVKTFACGVCGRPLPSPWAGR